jgi:hypothetical protein
VLLALGALLAAVETALGVGLLVGARGAAGASLAALGLLTAILTARGVSEGWRVSCHCLSVIGTQSLPFAIARNLLLALALAWAVWARRGAPTKP